MSSELRFHRLVEPADLSISFEVNLNKFIIITFIGNIINPLVLYIERELSLASFPQKQTMTTKRTKAFIRDIQKQALNHIIHLVNIFCSTVRTFREHAKQEIVQILDRISTLRPVEKLLLYLRLPGEQPETGE